MSHIAATDKSVKTDNHFLLNGKRFRPFFWSSSEQNIAC